MYIDLFNRPPIKITAAPSWKLLKEYGGHFSIEQFRKSFNTIEYSYKDFFRNIKSIAHVFEENKLN